MNIILYPLLSTCSKRALLRSKKRYGNPYRYSPRGTLLQRLSTETGMSMTEVYNQLMKERDYLIKDIT